MSKIFPKINIKFYSNVIILQLTTKFMNIFIYFITTYYYYQ